ncbi:MULTISPECIES: META domain-containing protein [unclassified Cryobacterium]|uniref:META domain-containing protein n=1 Tax=unclassified Cryobacterium TaxID=2649013 RepID=UPI00106A17F7|nr:MULTISPECIES: META domain-containing protein [unclassified Cryobacterium]TFC50403.1 META domain-containing protein [Cryobacterium sp. TMB3-1-2]TFC71862.1 META domain-containing protein [Cryobacterium sp. TMB3-15]TFC78455.1 META domain-containing protein [Cryobacterium sp. TMB3-10]TFD44512.1 META domain-containing protein [Cryobacterium sp. TMB3-12]
MATHPPTRFLVASAAVLLLVLAGCSIQTPNSASSSGTVQAGALVGTWVLEETFDSPEQPYISFVQDNTWSASDGCNRVQGTWEVDSDGTLTTTSGPQTMMACPGAQLPLAVTRGTRVEVDGDTLVIHSSFDSTATTLVRSTDSTVGPQGLPIGYWVESNTPTAPFLSIEADGTYSGNDGCNVLTGSWEQADDEAILFTGGVTTLIACEGVDQWLNQAAQGRVQAGVMTLQAADGTVLGQLTAR